VVEKISNRFCLANERRKVRVELDDFVADHLAYRNIITVTSKTGAH